MHRLLVQVDSRDLAALFADHGVGFSQALDEISVYTLNGAQLARHQGLGTEVSYTFELAPEDAYLIKGRLVDGATLWGVAPSVSESTDIVISLGSTYEATLIFASLGARIPSGEEVSRLKRMAAQALDQDLDRLVKTVKRVVDSAVLKQIDYSPLTESTEPTLRAFGGGLQPVRPLERILESPERDYVPHLYVHNTWEQQGEPFRDRILMSELTAGRWEILVRVKDIPPAIYRGLGGLHVAQGGTKVAFGSEVCITVSPTGECRLFQNAIHSTPIAAPPGTEPTQLTSPHKFDARHPEWSWDEARIAFHACEKLNCVQAVGQIYVMNDDGTALNQLTFDTGINGSFEPAWSPDDTKIVYQSDRERQSWDIWIMNADGSGNTNLTSGQVRFPKEPRFSPDGRHIVFVAHDEASRGLGDTELWVMNRDGGNLHKLTDNMEDDSHPVWAPNGLHIFHSVGEDTWVARNALTGEVLYEFPGLARGKYADAVLAATAHILVPSRVAIEAGKVSETAYVDKEWQAAQVEGSISAGAYEGETSYDSGAASSGRAYDPIPLPTNPLWDFRYEIATALNDPTFPATFVPPPMTW